MCVCACVYVHMCACACVRACVRAGVCACLWVCVLIDIAQELGLRRFIQCMPRYWVPGSPGPVPWLYIKWTCNRYIAWALVVRRPVRSFYIVYV